MTTDNIITQLHHNQTTFKGLLQHKTTEEYLWRPEENKWCLLEIACHLLDEEREDFRARIRYIFEPPDYEMPSINPPAWVAARNYLGQDYSDVVNAFLEERKTSVTWLKKHKADNWEQSINHPKLGEMSARLFLANWLAHDYLHIRQILSLQYVYLKTQSGLNFNYAGNW